ncbi:MAG TPA: tetratricopeptide repeat protein [Oceanithermus profundus]|uniref:Tetratricopeptide repeat protein n=1 Tax=Oceanithermus profundus TaxID=187137 RepID=A0A7C4VCJ2_9DEIN|nr:tetratricopeptide repeat protein [Oceanithermus profundus]
MRAWIWTVLLWLPVLALSPEAEALLKDARALAEQARQTYEAHFPDKPLWAEAIAKAEKARELEPESAEVWRTLAEIYTATGWWSRAEKAWERYLALSDESDPAPLAEALRALGFLAYQRGDVKASMEYFQQALVLEPENEEALAWLGRIYLELGDGVQAAEYWRLAAKVNPSPRNTYFAEQAEKMARYGPEAVKAFYQGYAAWEAKDYATAADRFQAAVGLAPGWSEAHRWLARVLMEAGQPAKAIPHWQKVIELEGSAPDAEHFLKLAREAAGVGVSAADAFFKGVAAYEAGRLDEAERWFTKATEADPSYAKAWRWLGRVRYERGQYEAAVQAYEKAVELNPDDSSARYFLRLARQAVGE